MLSVPFFCAVSLPVLRRSKKKPPESSGGNTQKERRRLKKVSCSCFIRYITLTTHYEKSYKKINKNVYFSILLPLSQKNVILSIL